MEFVPRRFDQFFRKMTDDSDKSLRILDIGGGRITRVPCNNETEITVLDTSSDALEDHDGPGRIVEKLVGDAQDFDYGDRQFDVAVFWNVLEHVDQPDLALAKACGQLDEGGLLVVRGPELGSLKSLITRMTPHFVHVLFYRWVLGIADAGRDGRPPCPVRHQPKAAPQSLVRQLKRLGFRVRFEMHYVGDQVMELRRFSKPAYWLYSGASAALRAVSGRRLGSRETEFILVAQRGGATKPHPRQTPAYERAPQLLPA